MELQKIHIKYELKIKDIFGTEHLFSLIAKEELEEYTPETLLKAVLNSIAIIKYFYDTNTLVIQHKEDYVEDVIIKLDSMNSKQTKNVIILRNLFDICGVRSYDEREARNLMDQYFCVVIPMLFNELTYR